MIQRFAPAEKKPEAPRPPDPRRAAIIGLVIVLLLVLAGLLLTRVLRDLSNVQDCAMQGRTNCAPVQ